MATGNYYLFGSPISASPSPTLHNSGFTAKQLNLTYSLCDTDKIEEVEATLKKEGTLGGSVTIPHKQTVIPLLDSLSEEAKEVKAVNTVKKVDDKLEGYNTDWWAIYYLTKQSLQRNNYGGDYSDLVAVVVGAGGTAYAACYSMKRLKVPFYVWNRTPEKAVELAKEFGGNAIDDLEKLEKVDIVVSTVPPASAFMLPQKLLNSNVIVVELVYHPRHTALVKQAYAHNCIIVEGSEILFVQGIKQFEIWTGLAPPQKEMAHAFVYNHNNGLLKEDTPYTFCKILNSGEKLLLQ